MFEVKEILFLLMNSQNEFFPICNISFDFTFFDGFTEDSVISILALDYSVLNHLNSEIVWRRISHFLPHSTFINAN